MSVGRVNGKDESRFERYSSYPNSGGADIPCGTAVEEPRSGNSSKELRTIHVGSMRQCFLEDLV